MAAELKKIKQLYRKDEFWSKVDRSLYSIFSEFQSPLKWAKIFPDFLKECEHIENTRGYVMRTTEEITQGFFERLIYSLHLKGLITNQEINDFMSLFRGQTSVWNIPQNSVAQQIIFKAMLEAGLKRKKETLTVFHLFECPIFKPLPSSAMPDLNKSPQQFMFEITKFKKSPDFHIITASRIAEYEYIRAIRLLSQKYLDMEIAYNEIRKKSAREDYEERFVKIYHMIMEMP